MSFDLINMEKRKGDRNVKENDKHLFLETLLSAQEYLYISYLGQSVKDNSTVPPSILVDELIDYIQAECDGLSVTKELMTKHALHGFSEKYHLGDPKLYNYLNRQPESELGLGSQEKVDQLDHNEIRMDSLINFLKHPIKGYFNTVLSIYYNDEEVLLPETEVFDVDHLQKWNLKQRVLKLDQDQLEELKSKLVKTGGLPLRNMATVTVDTIEEEVAPIRELYRECIGEEEERHVSIDIDFEELNVNLKGTLNRVYGNKLIVLSWSKNETKYLLEAYIKLLCAKASGLDLDIYFISAAKGMVFQAAALDSVQAKEALTDLLSLYMEGHQSILPFNPDFDIKPKDLESLTLEGFKKKVDSRLNSFNVSFADPYMMSKYKEGYYDSEQVFEQYKENAEKLLLPLGELFADYYQ